MKLSMRLIISHLVVVAFGALVTFSVVFSFAPADFDRRIPPGRSEQPEVHAVREHFIGAVTDTLFMGTAIGVVLAAFLGIILARQLLRPLQTVSAAAGAMAAGDYGYRVDVPNEPELAILAQDINALGEALAEVEATRMRLIGEVAHELRTPLTIIDGNVEGMIDGVVAADPEHLSLISAEVRRLRRLSDDLTALSRAQEGRININLETVPLDPLTTTLLARFAVQAEDAGITLERRGTFPTVVADPDRVTQVLTNVIGNALRATPPGGTITVAGEFAGNVARIHIHDTGIGIASEELPRIFERFYRSNGTTHSEGSGVGLTIARQLMRGMNGELSATSEGPGNGATFTLELPVRNT
ncbi:cell wall metabolism sensor histidine kinase WalK [Corynebacterium sp.]|uniref:sensor histidine kinase n=1 Tax=Corynebacterium sp. TaxID=1720 RepID=UPI0026DDCC53|nr:ATP-binding protein [Corynebacterium sp.]MDO5077574.1 ATP-binding protein [Corynebacterium sp.]